jgi:hypothetical protein
LRRTAIVLTAGLWASVLFLKHTAIVTMKRGDFWIFSLFRHEILLPHPCDYLFIYQLPKIIFEGSFLLLIAVGLAYWYLRRREKRCVSPIAY